MKKINKTKILITMGPSLEKNLKKVINLIDGVRFNMSHASTKDIERHIDILEKNKIAKLMDLKGNKIRIIKSNINNIKGGDEIIIGKDIILSYNPSEDVEEDNFILINDGKIKLKIKKINNELIYTDVLVGGEVKNEMGVNFPDTYLKAPILSDADIDNIKFAIEKDFEYIALSFVRNKEDVINLREIIKENNGDISIVAKIETKEGLNNIEEIVQYSDGVMVARGDLGVEIPIEYIPIEQKKIISTGNKWGKLTITATQMLDSMINNPYPTRAEITDIANAIFDGTDCLMLSNETTIGKYPVEAVKVMNRVARISEYNMDKFATEVQLEGSSISIGIAHAAYTLYNKLNPKIIITPTWSGNSAILISKFRPKVPIIAISPNIRTFKKLRLFWGIVPHLTEVVDSIDEILEISKNVAEEFIDEGIYITTLGHPPGENKTNVIKVDTVKGKE
ncbi:pyruvate kinase [Methanothermococcus sp. SCGC AD-155-M21]|nr:pyruvate kinase [Methanothermococcus sp. SCGC AD-155-M21]